MRITVAAMRPMNIRPPITLPAIIPGMFGGLCGEGLVEGTEVEAEIREGEAVEGRNFVVVVVARLDDGICARTMLT